MIAQCGARGFLCNWVSNLLFHLEPCLCREEGQEAAPKLQRYSPSSCSQDWALHTVSHCERLWTDLKRTLPHCKDLFFFFQICEHNANFAPPDTPGERPLFVYMHESSVLLISLFSYKKHLHVVCAALIHPLIMSLCPISPRLLWIYLFMESQILTAAGGLISERRAAITHFLWRDSTSPKHVNGNKLRQLRIRI